MVKWSYSSLTTFEKCPRQYEKTRVTQEVVDKGSAATAWGTKVHEAFERRIRDGVALPSEIAQCEPFVGQFCCKGRRVMVEHKMALNRRFYPVDFDSPDYWCRGIADVVVLHHDKALVVDWKTGAVRKDSRQLVLMAAMVFAHFKELVSCKTAFVWVAHDKTTTETFQRHDVPTLWQEFLPKVRCLESAYELNKWLPQPGKLCGW